MAIIHTYKIYPVIDQKSKALYTNQEEMCEKVLDLISFNIVMSTNGWNINGQIIESNLKVPMWMHEIDKQTNTKINKIIN